MAYKVSSTHMHPPQAPWNFMFLHRNKPKYLNDINVASNLLEGNALETFFLNSYPE